MRFKAYFIAIIIGSFLVVSCDFFKKTPQEKSSQERFEEMKDDRCDEENCEDMDFDKSSQERFEQLKDESCTDGCKNN